MGILERLGLRTRTIEQQYRERQPEQVRVLESAFDSNGYLVQPARTFSGLINQFSRVYSDKWDEALRDWPQNAISMENDAYFTALMEERTQPLRRWKWHIDHIDDPDQKADPEAENIRKQLSSILSRTSRLPEMRDYLREAVWYGRYGSQLQRTKQTIGGFSRWVITDHVPIHGDSLRYDFDGNWCVAINAMDMAQYGEYATYTDRMPVLRLSQSEYRQRFVIHRRRVRAGRYFEPYTAGMLGGVGIRHQVYWAWWLRDRMLSSAVSFLDKVGTMGLLLVYYTEGNNDSLKKAEETARKASQRNAIAVPRPDGKSSNQTAAVELIPANMGGVQFLTEFIGRYFEKHIERLVVGQSLSAGTEGSGLGGSGVADLHMDTKYNLLASDAEDMDATYTSDVVQPTKELNFPGVPYEYRWVHSVPDPASDKKLQAVQSAVSMGVEFVKDEVRSLTGMSKPEEGEETIGGQQPGGAPGDPNGSDPAGQPPQTGDDPDQLEAIADKIEAGEELTPEEQALADSLVNNSSLATEQLYAGSDWEAPADGRKYWRRKKASGGYEYSETKPGERTSGQNDVQTPAKANDTPADPQSQKRVDDAKERIVAAHSGLAEPQSEGKDGQIPEGHEVGKATESLFGKVRRYGSAALDNKLVRVAFAIEHKLYISATKMQELAKETVAQKNLSEDNQKRLTTMLAVGDLWGRWAGSAALAMSGGIVAGKVASAVAPASAVYLMYSTALNPLATWRAARKVIANTSLSPMAAGRDIKAAWKGEQHHSLQSWLETLYADGKVRNQDAEADAAVRLADALAASPDPDRFFALFMAALSSSPTPDHALQMAESADSGLFDEDQADEQKYSDWEAPTAERKNWRRKKQDGSYEYSSTKPGDRGSSADEPSSDRLARDDSPEQVKSGSAKDRIADAIANQSSDESSGEDYETIQAEWQSRQDSRDERRDKVDTITVELSHIDAAGNASIAAKMPDNLGERIKSWKKALNDGDTSAGEVVLQLHLEYLEHAQKDLLDQLGEEATDRDKKKVAAVFDKATKKIGKNLSSYREAMAKAQSLNDEADRLIADGHGFPEEYPEPEPEEPTEPDTAEPVEPDPNDYELGEDDEQYKIDVEQHGKDLEDWQKEQDEYAVDHEKWKSDHAAWEKASAKHNREFERAGDKHDRKIDKLQEKANEILSDAESDYLDNSDVESDLDSEINDVLQSIIERIDAESDADLEPDEPDGDETSYSDWEAPTGKRKLWRKKKPGGGYVYSENKPSDGGFSKTTTGSVKPAAQAKPQTEKQPAKNEPDPAMRQRVEDSLGQGWKQYAETRSKNHGVNSTDGRMAESVLRQRLKKLAPQQLSELIQVHSKSPKDGFAEWANMANEFLQSMAIGFNLKPGVLIDGTDADLGLALNAKLTVASEPESKVRPGDRVKFVSHYDTLRDNELVYGRVILVTNGSPEQNGLFVYYNWSDGAGKSAFADNGDGIKQPKKLCSVEEFYQNAGKPEFREQLRDKLSLTRSAHKKLRKAMDEYVISQIEETANEVNTAANTIRKYGGDERAAQFVGKATTQLMEADSEAALAAVAAQLGVTVADLKALKKSKS